MQTIIQKILALSGYQAKIGGRVFQILSCDQGSVLNITLVDAMGVQYSAQNVGAGAKFTPATGFDSINISTPADANVEFIVTNGDCDIQITNGQTQITNGQNNPVPVSLVADPAAPIATTVQGTVTVTGVTLTATDVGIVPAGSGVTDVGQVAVGTSGAQVLAAAAGRKRAIFYNAGTVPVALTAAAATTFANAAIVLQPGDAWKETDAPQLAWFAVAQSAGALNIQTVI